MSSDEKNALLIFSKAPIPGITKTRLKNVLSEPQRLSLHLALLQDTILNSRQVKARKVLYLSEFCELPFSTNIEICLQKGKDLGERLQEAFVSELSRSSSVVIIGSDSPMLQLNQIENAFEKLKTNDVVIGPAEDGGYYLIGLSQIIPELFTGIPWGSSGVLQATLNASSGRKVEMLESCWDIDLPEDLLRLHRELKENAGLELPSTRAWMKDWNRS